MNKKGIYKVIIEERATIIKEVVASSEEEAQEMVENMVLDAHDVDREVDVIPLNYNQEFIEFLEANSLTDDVENWIITQDNIYGEKVGPKSYAIRTDRNAFIESSKNLPTEELVQMAQRRTQSTKENLYRLLTEIFVEFKDNLIIDLEAIKDAEGVVAEMDMDGTNWYRIYDGLGNLGSCDREEVKVINIRKEAVMLEGYEGVIYYISFENFIKAIK